MYHVVEKIEVISEELVYTVVGYVNNDTDKNSINSQGYNSFIDWMIDTEEDRQNQTTNNSDCTFLPCYGVRSTTNNRIEMTFISNIDELESL